MFLHIIDHDIRSIVEHFHPVRIRKVKILFRIIRRECNISPGRMPGGIDQSGNSPFGLRIQLLDITIRQYVGPGM